MTVTVTTRAGKGSPLTHSEVDANFTDLAAAVNGAGGGWTQIGSTNTTTGGANVDFTSIPGTYEDLQLKIKDISDSAGSAQIGVKVSSDNGSTWSANGIVLVSSSGGGATYTGSVLISDYTANFGAALVGVSSNLSAPDAGANTYANSGGGWDLGAPINAIRLYTSAGTFDAMNASLFGK